MSIKFENKKHIIQYFEKGSKKKNEKLALNMKNFYMM